MKPDSRWLIGPALVYIAAITVMTLTLAPYFARGWDVTTFIAAGRSFFLADHPFALYAESRRDFYWPYAYPPLHAALTALPLLITYLLPAMPDTVPVRWPVILADLGLACALFRVVLARSGRPDRARLAALLYLANPVTLYQTAVQAHFESEWLLLVVLAYTLASTWSEERRGVVVPSLLLGLAILVKQIALIYTIPFGLWLLLRTNGERRMTPFILSIVIVAGLVLLVCLPFLLYSGDFLYMIAGYVATMPVQVQSAMVWCLALEPFRTGQTTTTFPLVRYATPLIVLISTLAAFWLLRRGRNLFEIGLVVTLIFFLLTQKALGYYYVMLIPFLLIVAFDRDDLGLALGGLLLSAWVFISPYYAPWAARHHLPVYALLGSINTVGWLVLLWRTIAHPQLALRRPIVSAASLFLGIAGPAVAVFVASSLQPIYARLGPTSTGGLLLLTYLLTLAGVALLHRAVRDKIGGGRPAGPAWLPLLLLTPLYFNQFTLTQESTRVFEAWLQRLSF